MTLRVEVLRESLAHHSDSAEQTGAEQSKARGLRGRGYGGRGVVVDYCAVADRNIGRWRRELHIQGLCSCAYKEGCEDIARFCRGVGDRKRTLSKGGPARSAGENDRAICRRNLSELVEARAWIVGVAGEAEGDAVQGSKRRVELAERGGGYAVEAIDHLCTGVAIDCEVLCDAVGMGGEAG